MMTQIIPAPIIETLSQRLIRYGGPFQVLADRKEITTEAWHNLRRTGVGASEVGAILGLSPYQTPFDVWASKTGRTEAIDDNNHMYWGRMLEDDIIEATGEELGIRTECSSLMLRSQFWPHMLCNLDGLADGGAFCPPIEAKSSERGAGWKEDDIPDSAHLQVMTQMAVIGCTTGYLSVLWGGANFKVHTISYDSSIVSMIGDAIEEFWKLVEKDTPPTCDINLDVVKTLYPKGSGDTLIMPGNYGPRVEYFLKLKAFAKRVDEEIDSVQAEICAAIGDYTKGVCSSYELNWANVETERLDTKRLKKERPDIHAQYLKKTSSRRLTIKEQEDGEVSRAIEAASAISAIGKLGYLGEGAGGVGSQAAIGYEGGAADGAAEVVGDIS